MPHPVAAFWPGRLRAVRVGCDAGLGVFWPRYLGQPLSTFPTDIEVEPLGVDDPEGIDTCPQAVGLLSKELRCLLKILDVVVEVPAVPGSPSSLAAAHITAVLAVHVGHPSPDATPTDTPSPALPAPPLTAVAPTPTPGASFWPRVLLAEFLADPKAVADSAGEWVELYNPNQEAVNLAGWNLADADGERHTFVGELWLPPGAYLVVGRNADRAVNGGAPVEYVYRGFTLANGADDFLFAPNGVETDRVVWGDNGGLVIIPGSSLERTDWTLAAAWATSKSPWPGSAGDNGSPGSPIDRRDCRQPLEQRRSHGCPLPHLHQPEPEISRS